MINSFGELRQELDENHGLLTVSMRTLRDLVDRGRLGVHVCTQIEKELQKHGIGHLMRMLPVEQDIHIRLYALGSPAEELLKAARTLGKASDKTLRQYVANVEGQKLPRIREQVEQLKADLKQLSLVLED
jgi:hypothetical protein